MKNKIAIMYDFDGTLIKGCAQEYDMFKALKASADFWTECDGFSQSQNSDMMLGTMYFTLDSCNKRGIRPTRKFFSKQAKNLKYFPGVETWFERINEFCKLHDIIVEHYIISSNLKEVLEGSSIAKYFKKIFSSEYMYNKEGIAFWPSQVVNFTTKTQFIARIRKNCTENLFDFFSVNKKEHNESNVEIPYSNMVYIGDGFTDVPSMKMVKGKGGMSFCVYDPSDKDSMQQAISLLKDKRVNAYAETDYTENSKLDKLVKQFVIKTAKKINKTL